MRAAWRFNPNRLTSTLLMLSVFSSMTYSQAAFAQRPLPTAAASVVQQLQVLESDSHTRLAIDLTTSAQDVIVQDEPGKPMTVSFKGSSAALLNLPLNRNFSWPNLKGIFVDQQNGRVQIFIKRTVTGSVKINATGSQLLLDVPHVFVRTSGADNEISPGVKHTNFVEHLSSGPVRINVLEIDPRNPAVEITPALASNRMGSKANVAAMVSGHQAIAGINGSFFKQDKGIPLGILIINQELISGPIYDRVALAVSPTNELTMDRVKLGGEIVLPDRKALRVNTINQPRVKADQTVIYTSRWGQVAPAVPSNGLQVLLRNDRVASVSRTEPIPIPKDGVVISGPATPELLALSNLGPSMPVQLNVYTLPDWSSMKHAIGGGPWLVKNGQPYVDLQAQHFTSKSLGTREPRTAVGITANGKMLLVTVDGRHKNVSIGMTIYEMAHLMKKLGAVNAMNLDGGSSTQMSVFGRMVNMPSAGMVGVSNSLIVKRSNNNSVAEQTPLSPVNRR